MGCISVDIDTDDVLYGLSDKELLAEVRRRKINMPDEPHDTIRTAIAQIHRGDTMDAVTTLEREFFPKWDSVDASHLAYLAAVRPANYNATAQAVAEEG